MPPESPGDEVVFDKAALLERVSGDEAFCKQLLGIFLKDLEAQLTELRGAKERNDLDALARGAHQLKGSTSNVGALRLSAVARDLEQSIRDEDSEAVGKAWERLDVECEAIRAALRGEGIPT